MKKVLASLFIILIMISCSNTEDFDSFYSKFMTEPEFQISRVNFPIEGTYEDFETSEKWTAENWDVLKYSLDELDPIEWEIKREKKDNEVSEGVYCRGCGFSFEIKFELIDGEWFVTYRQENNF